MALNDGSVSSVPSRHHRPPSTPGLLQWPDNTPPPSPSPTPPRGLSPSLPTPPPARIDIITAANSLPLPSDADPPPARRPAIRTKQVKDNTVNSLPLPSDVNPPLVRYPVICTNQVNEGTSTNSLPLPSDTNPPPVRRPMIRTRQPSGGTSTIKFGAQVTHEEAEALQKKRPGMESKRREMSGSGIFSPETSVQEKSTVVAGDGVSEISSGSSVNDIGKPTSLTVVAKQRELCGNGQGNVDMEKPGKPLMRGRTSSKAKSKELAGSNIFGPRSPPHPPPRPTVASQNLEEKIQQENNPPPTSQPKTSIKVSNPAGGRSQFSFGSGHSPSTALGKASTQKMTELSGNNIFKKDGGAVAGAGVSSTPREKHASLAKLKEMSGSDIFADGKATRRECLGGIRQPPGGDSTLTLG